MPKTSIRVREAKKKLCATKAMKSRTELRNLIKDANISYDEKVLLCEKLNKKPRNESLSRCSRRCELCGRPRGVYRRFGLCRLCLRNAAMRGDLPGVTKASW